MAMRSGNECRPRRIIASSERHRRHPQLLLVVLLSIQLLTTISSPQSPVSLQHLVAIGKNLRHPIVAPQVAPQGTQVVFPGIGRLIDAFVPPHESHVVRLERLDNILNLLGSREVVRSNEGYSAWISQPEVEAEKLISEKVIRRMRSLQHPLCLLVEAGLEKGCPSTGKIKIPFPPDLGQKGAHDRQNQDCYP